MASSFTAKVKIGNVVVTPHGTQVSFYPDYTDGRNKEWAESTPSLGINMTVKNELGETLEIGKSYTLTFDPTDN